MSGRSPGGSGRAEVCSQLLSANRAGGDELVTAPALSPTATEGAFFAVALVLRAAAASAALAIAGGAALHAALAIASGAALATLLDNCCDSFCHSCCFWDSFGCTCTARCSRTNREQSFCFQRWAFR